MFEENQIDNGKFILAGNAKFPDWVLFSINQFKTKLYEITKSNDQPTEEVLNQIIKLFEAYILPKGVKLDKRINKKELNRLIDSYSKVLEDQEFVWYNWLILNAGFFLSTVLPTSIDEDSLTVPEEIRIKREAATKRFKESGDKYAYNKEIQSISKDVLKWMSDNDNAIADFVMSGANGSLTHLQELLVGLGFAINAKGEITDTITNCLVEGVSQTDYFSNSSQGIISLFAKSNETSKPGYLGKKLSNICEKVKLGEYDCGTQGRIKINTRNKEFLKSLVGMNFSTTKTGKVREFTEMDTKDSISTNLFFRTPLHCRAKGMYICQKCYSAEYIRNFNLKTNDNIGLHASTGLTGDLVNLTLKKSHVGVSLDLEEVNLKIDLS